MPLRVSRFGLPIAVEIRCRGKAGRCGRQIGIAAIPSHKGAGGAVLHMTNEGWALDHGFPLYEDRVPADFSGETGIIGCPRHGRYLEGKSIGPPRFPGLPPEGIRWTDGMGVCFPFLLLREPFEVVLRKGFTQSIDWLPGVFPTVVRSSFR
jgi:hypothetical protein